MKRIIGIMPTINLNESDNPYSDKYSFVDLYSQKIYNCDGIPVGIRLNNGKLNYKSLAIYNTFIIPDGNKIDKNYYKLIYYCLKNNKPLLGICMGSEAIAIFSNILSNIKNIKDEDELITLYEQLKKDNNGTFLTELSENNIHNYIIKRDNKDIARHEIRIKKNTILYDIYQKDKISVISLHNHDYQMVGSNFIISSYAPVKVNIKMHKKFK